MPRWLILILCALVLYLSHFYHLGQMPFFGADEPRYARVAEEMNLRHDYVTPTLNFRPWLEKPPLLYWLQAGSYRLLGVSEFSARLPSALLGCFCILFTACFAWLTGTSRLAVLTILILSTSPLFLGFSRAGSTDMPLAATYSVAVIAAYLAIRQESLSWSSIAGVFLGLALLAKGPVALILFSGTYACWALLEQRFPWKLSHSLTGAASFLVVACPWFWWVWKENGYDFVATFVVNHHLARFLTDIHRHSQPSWFYLPVLILGFFPWTPFLFSNLKRAWQRRRWPVPPLSEAWILWLWVLIPLVFFSLSESKLPGYVLLVFPALALLAAREWNRYLEDDLTVCRCMKGEMAVLSAFGGVVVLGLPLASFLAYQNLVFGVVLAVPLAAGIIWARREFHHKRPIQLFLSLVAGLTLFVAVAYWQIAPRVGNFHSAKTLVTSVLPELSRHQPLVLYRYFHHTALYYADYNALPESLPDWESMKNYLAEHPQPRYYILTQREGWNELIEKLRVDRFTRIANLYLVEYSQPVTDPPDPS